MDKLFQIVKQVMGLFSLGRKQEKVQPFGHHPPPPKRPSGLSHWKKHVHGLMRGGQHFFRTPLRSLFNSLVIGLVLSIPAAVYLIFDNFTQAIDFNKNLPHISVYLELTATNVDIDQVRERLQNMNSIASQRFVSKEQALSELESELKMNDLMQSLEINPLPDAFILTPKSTQLGQLEQLALELKKIPRVADVQLDTIWTKHLDAFLDIGRQVSLFSSLLLSGLVLVVISNTIHLQILARREEIEVCLLIGADYQFIQRPFVYFGIVQGFFGGLLAVLTIQTGGYYLHQSVMRIIDAYKLSIHLNLLSGSDMVGLVLFACLLGAMGAYISVIRNVRLIEKELE